MKCTYVSILMFVFVSTGKCHFYLVDRGMARMIKLIPEKPFCQIYTDRDFIKTSLNSITGDKFKITSKEEIYKLEHICNKKQMRSSHQGGFIYPGTKWCGPGNVAKNFDDLGTHQREDMCCREHDNCLNSIAGGQCKKNLCNKTLFTRSHCDCDNKFKECLQDANSETGNTIGAIFFNVAQVICFKPQASCQSVDIENCNYEFVLSDRYLPSEATHHYRTRGEVVEKYVNRALRKLNFL